MDRNPLVHSLPEVTEQRPDSMTAAPPPGTVFRLSLWGGDRIRSLKINGKFGKEIRSNLGVIDFRETGIKMLEDKVKAQLGSKLETRTILIYGAGSCGEGGVAGGVGGVVGGAGGVGAGREEVLGAEKSRRSSFAGWTKSPFGALRQKTTTKTSSLKTMNEINRAWFS